MSIRQIGDLDSINNLSATDKLIVQKQNMAHAIPTVDALNLLGNIELSGLDTTAKTLIGAINELYATARGVTGVWLGTQAEYDAIVEKNQNTIYIIQLLSSIVIRVYFGYTKIYPTDSDFDFIVTDQEFFGDRYIDTGIVPFSNANADKSWMIEADIAPNEYTTENRFGIAFGVGASNGTYGLSNGFSVNLYLSDPEFAYGYFRYPTWGEPLAPQYGQLKAPLQFRIYKTGDNYAMYDWNDTLYYSYAASHKSGSPNTIRLGGGLYGNDGDYPYYRGKINKFGFKWL